MSERLPQWRVRLGQYLAQAARRPFAEGQHDCALFAAGAIEAMTGEDPAAPFRGRYTTTRGGLRLLRQAGFEDHVDLVAARLPEVPRARAMPGDLALIPAEAGAALGVVQGESVYVLAPGGLGLVPMAQAARFWRVG